MDFEYYCGKFEISVDSWRMRGINSREIDEKKLERYR